MSAAAEQPLWRPDDDSVAASNVTAFIDRANASTNAGLTDFKSLHAWSVADKPAFWRTLVDYAGVKAERWGDTVIADEDKMPGARFFPDARLNYAENLLSVRDDGDAMVFWGEDQVRRRLSRRQLHDEVSRLAQAFKSVGVGPGDRVAGYLPNMPEAVIGMLAAASLGAVWSSASPDFGVQGVLDRFGQIEPKVLLACDGYFYNGKSHDCLEKLAAIQARLPSLARTVVVPYVNDAPDLGEIPDSETWFHFVEPFQAGEIDFVQMPFNAPLYIMFSSGTTGVPKCIVHSAGGVLLKHLSEHLLHCDEKPGDRVFYFTTTGWMMWNWLVSALACGATLLLYDGAPFHPDGNVLFDFAEAEGMTLFGTSAKYIDAVKKAGLRPAESHDLSTVRLMTSTGSPLAPESFDFVYSDVKPDIHLASISGGTDIVGCFVLGDPTGPVWRGEIQARGLGLDVNVFNADGRPVVGEAGDLVCTGPFPSMPVGFWNDPDGTKYRAAYFETYPGVWCHGDWAEITGHGGVIIYGRSDATLNPGGVRIGTAEIYRQVEQFDDVLEALAVGQDWDGDTRIVLFVAMRDGKTLTDDFADRIRRRIRENCSPRHVPAKIIAVPDIPRTKSGKITELAVRDVIHGRPVKNAEALANAAALEHFKDLAELRS